MKQVNKLYTLMPLDDFKAVFGIDDRDDKTSRFCLVTATHTIEKHCHRRFLRKKYFEVLNLYDELCLPLYNYPISEILAVYMYGTRDEGQGTGILIEPEFYRALPDQEYLEDVPHFLCLSPALIKMGCKAVKAVYYSGYKTDDVPSDLQAACMELAVWSFSRYKSRRVGITGSVRKEGEQLEKLMPENVKALLEPYRRKTI